MSDDQSPRPRRTRGHWLAPGARAGNGLGILTQPLRPYPEHHDPDDLAREAEKVREATRYCDEPEKISGAILDAYGKDAKHYSALRHAAEVEVARETRKDLRPENRLADVRRRAKQKKINLTHQCHKIQTALDRARRAGRDPGPAVVEKIVELEAFLDGDVLLDRAA